MPFASWHPFRLGRCKLCKMLRLLDIHVIGEETQHTKACTSKIVYFYISNMCAIIY